MAQTRVERITNGPIIVWHGEKSLHVGLYRKDVSNHGVRNMKNRSKNKNESMCILTGKTPGKIC